MNVRYNSDLKLNGIIYLHRITDSKIQGNATKHIKMFRKLVGSTAMKNILLLTTMWEKEEISIGQQREEELERDFWSDLLQLKARICRHSKNTKQSAFEILDLLLWLPRVDLKIQQEMVREKKSLTETDVGGVIRNEEVAEAKTEFQKQKKDLQKDKERALKVKDTQWKARQGK
jgi:hypothetical protein